MTLVRIVTAIAVFAAAAVSPAFAQQPQPAPESEDADTGGEEGGEAQGRSGRSTYCSRTSRTAYVWNMGRTGRHERERAAPVRLRCRYTFNMAEFSIKKDPSERYLRLRPDDHRRAGRAEESRHASSATRTITSRP